MNPAALTPDEWARLSPELDALLDLQDTAARQARLAMLRAADAPLADALSALLARQEVLDAGLLAAPALPPLQALAELAADAQQQPGQVVGAYTLQSLLGEGGMGSVWLASRSDGRFQGRVAIKFLRAGLAGAGEAARFAREGAILARLAHPHIARLLDAGIADGRQPFLVIEHVDGLPIDRWCTEQALGPAEVVALVLQVVDAVAHAHTRLILHRDLKPGNILVDGQGQAKLLDFGIAKLLDADDGAEATAITRRAGQAYTPLYAAPEQVQGGEVTTATDVYALGVLLYGLLGGGHPTTQATATPLQRLHSVVQVQPRRLSEAVRAAGGADATRHARALQGDLETIVAMALKKAPTERYANAAALADDLRRWQQHAPVAARPDSASYRMARFARRHRGGVAAALLALLSLGAGLGTALWQGHEAGRQRAQAEALVDFMLGELRQRLEPVGRLDVLDAVGDKVLQHYAQLAGASGGDATLEQRRASALLLLGEVAERRRRLDEAAQRFDAAATLTAGLLQRRPGDRQVVALHLSALGAVYDLAQLRGERNRLDSLAASMRPLVDRLRRTDPADDGARWQEAQLLRREGVRLHERGQLAEAWPALLQARALLSGLVPRHPAWQYDLGNVLGSLSRVAELRGDLTTALQLQDARRDAMLAVPDGTSDRRAQVDTVAAASERARLMLLQGQHGEAEAAYRDALARSDRLMAGDPDNAMWLRQAVNLRISLGHVLLAREAYDEAARLNDAGRASLAPTLAQARPERFYRSVLQGHLLAQRGRLALALPARQDRAGASAALAAYVADMARVATPGEAPDVNEQRALGLALLAQGDLLEAAGQSGQARQAWQAAIDRNADARDRRDAQRIVVQGEARLRLGDRAGARADAEAAAAIRPQLLQLALLERRLAGTSPRP